MLDCEQVRLQKARGKLWGRRQGYGNSVGGQARRSEAARGQSPGVPPPLAATCRRATAAAPMPAKVGRTAWRPTLVLRSPHTPSPPLPHSTLTRSLFLLPPSSSTVSPSLPATPSLPCSAWPAGGVGGRGHHLQCRTEVNAEPRTGGRQDGREGGGRERGKGRKLRRRLPAAAERLGLSRNCLQAEGGLGLLQPFHTPRNSPTSPRGSSALTHLVQLNDR